MATVEATFTTTVSDAVAVSRAILYRGWSYWALLAVVVVPPASGVAWCECDLTRTALLAGVAVFGVVFWYLSPWIYVLSARRGAPNPDGPFKVALDESTVLVEAPHAKVEWKWEALHHTVETSSHVLLYVAKHQAQFIPKRVLSADALASLRSLLAEKLGARG